MTGMYRLFYELLQMSVGQRDSLSRPPSPDEWQQLFEMAQKQSVAALTFQAVHQLGLQGQKPHEDLIFEWLSESEYVKKRNDAVNRRCIKLSQRLAEAGFRSCILKGQGNALMYPDPYSRAPGDIDIWVEGERKAINDYVRSIIPDAREQQHHIDFPVFKHIPVEVHYTPGVLPMPKYNRRFQQFFRECMDREMTHQVSLPGQEGMVSVSTVPFNIVFLLAHLLIHFLISGIGLRQFIDYFYVLKAADGHDDWQETFRHLGLLRFARGVMWVEQQVFLLDDRYLLVEPDERLGRIILQEIEAGGDFGHYDQRYTLRKQGYLSRGLVDSYRLLLLAHYFPSECLWKIWMKLTNQKWKLK